MQQRTGSPSYWLRGALLLALGALAFAYLFPDTWARLGRVDAEPRAVATRGALTPDEQTNIDIFETWKASVVYISTSERVVDFWTRNVMSVPRGTGSGFVWDENGHIITNLHVIAGAAGANVRFADGRDYDAALVGASATHDIAVLRVRVPAGAPRPVAIGASHDLRVGQKVYAIGNPFGLDWSLTTGIVSALDRSLAGDDGGVIQHLIQTDAAINPGNSGGPLLDSAGRLIGINTAIYSPSGASAGVGFAVPVDIVNRVVPQLIATGRYAPPNLGIDTDDTLSRAIANQLGINGVAIARVEPQGTGARAGLRGVRIGPRNTVVPGDVILAVNGKEVTSSALLTARLDDFEVGDQVEIRVWREGKEANVSVTLQASEN